MKKLLLAALTLMVAVSCMKEGKNSSSWSNTYAGTLTTELSENREQVYREENVVAKLDCPDMFTKAFFFEFEGVRFVEAMPKLAITLPLTYELQKNENADLYDWVINQNDVVPTIGGVPYEAYKMSAVKGLVTNDSTKIEFWMNLRGVEYHVTYEWDRSSSGQSGDENNNTNE